MTTPNYANSDIPLPLRIAAAEKAAREGDATAREWAWALKMEAAGSATHSSGIDPGVAAGLTPDEQRGPGQMGGSESAARAAIEDRTATVRDRVFGFIDAVRNPDMPSVVPGRPVVDLTTGGAALDSFARRFEANRAAAYTDRSGPTHGTYGDADPQVRKAEAEGRWEEALRMKFMRVSD